MILSFDADPKSSASAPARPYFRQTNAIERSMSERLSRKKVSQFMAMPRAATMRVLDGVAILDEVTPRERGRLARTSGAAGRKERARRPRSRHLLLRQFRHVIRGGINIRYR